MAGYTTGAQDADATLRLCTSKQKQPKTMTQQDAGCARGFLQR
jgi:hypothetical protein